MHAHFITVFNTVIFCSLKHYKKIRKEKLNHKDQKIANKILSAGNVIFKIEKLKKNLQNNNQTGKENRKFTIYKITCKNKLHFYISAMDS